MPPKRSRIAALIESIEPITPLKAVSKPKITLGDEAHAETDEPPLSSPPLRAVQSSYPEPPPLPTQPTQPDEESETEDNKEENKLVWSEEMLEHLVEELYDVFIKGGGADNSFKKTTFQSAAKKVRTVYKGKLEITYAKCKNKWADLKRKWQHWVILSNQSGIGWVEETELYDFFDYVWDSLNKSYPKIIWHKTHVMPFRDLIGAILHDVQANGEESISLNVPTPIDPRLWAMDATRSSATTSPAPSSVSKTAKTPYNKSKKRTWVDTGDDSDDGTLAPAAKKVVDLAGALAGLSEEMARGRKAKEAYLTTQQKAIKLLEQAYKERLDMLTFVQACTFFKDDGNAATFITLSDLVVRDRWLELQLSTELLPLELGTDF
jgi:hypothetical protein